MKLAVLFSGGKDSTYALSLASSEHEIVGLITIKSENQDSYMFHTPAIKLTILQAEALGLPLFTGETKGIKEEELADLKLVLQQAQEKFGFAGIVTGAIFSEYQSSRIQKIAQELNLEVLSPLWHKDQEQLLNELVEKKFKFIYTAVAAEGLDQSWLNKIITPLELAKLKLLQQKKALNPAGEGGEMESLVLDCPLFKKKLVLDEVEIQSENKNTARLIIRKAHLV